MLKILFVFSVTGLMFILTGGEMVSEGKICSKKILERSDLKADDQLMVVRCGTDEVVAQLFCENWNCSDYPDTEGWFNQTEDLVLILPNCSSVDRLDILLNGNRIVLNFTFEEPVLSSTKEPPQTSSPNPPDSSGHLWLWLCALLILPVLAVIGFCWRKKHRKDREALPHDEEAKETPAVSSTASSNCTDNVVVCFKTCSENTDD
ncbi:uncharacterized protein LOC127944603 [Carassius gibelio]|uniref:uncharacterized protein LOC127944603 n=1 Tax=Carassius gibelio TaxID=101364 RepID=UPI002278288B|nr:uncharacterized protein LOC127944603 [Carassius gibelio]